MTLMLTVMVIILAYALMHAYDSPHHHCSCTSMSLRLTDDHYALYPRQQSRSDDERPLEAIGLARYECASTRAIADASSHP
jgi:hypothetical protein